MDSGFNSMKPSVPQYAEFDTGNKKDADALPAMPSWEDAQSKKVLIEEESVEMEPLKKPDPTQNPSHMNVASMPSSTSPHAISPYGPPAGPNAYAAVGRNDASPYGTSRQGYNEYDDQGYGQQYPSSGMNNTAVGMATGPMGRRTPQQDYNAGYDRNNMNQGYSQYPQSRSPRPYNDELGRSGTPGSFNNRDYQGMPVNDGYGNNSRRSPAPQTGYGYGNPRMGSPGAQAGYGYASARASPAPQADYGFPQRSHTQDEYNQQYPASSLPQRSHTQDEYTQQYPASSRQEYSNTPYEGFGQPALETYAQPSPPTSPIRNNGGFDFNSGYSRASPAPVQNVNGSGYNRPSPAPVQSANGGTAYPGYRNYKPAQNTQQQYAWEGV
ncbi:hypothetical protein EKO27_g4481 [Xylaria grammica]|uniref:Uncharacterized protein n=1 Tax=Xylaria grammica TaxID=363999 RepID=A0A439D879_9PEZI|nr:hypothetical protein EKO27_g4481 [Xylaria grammica]